jgi:hypothetical protein
VRPRFLTVQARAVQWIFLPDQTLTANTKVDRAETRSHHRKPLPSIRVDAYSESSVDGALTVGIGRKVYAPPGFRSNKRVRRRVAPASNLSHVLALEFLTVIHVTLSIK